jgi:N-acetyl sugar amidotransferase
MTDRPYQICSRCVMDTSDPLIRFDDDGICSYCSAFAVGERTAWTPEEGSHRLAEVVEAIRADGAGRPYDCVVGLSGGVDSTYVALRVKELGLRPLAVHFDGGWNSEISMGNIEQIVTRLSLDLDTVVCDWDEMRDLQRAFLRASLVNSDVPQDHAIIAVLFHAARRHRVRYIITGHNRATESCMSPAWRGHTSQDWRHIRAVHRRWGTAPLSSFPHFTLAELLLLKPYWWRLSMVNLLDYEPYVKADALRRIEAELGWRDYGGKHHESVFTRFFQTCYLPEKFGYDKRRSHLSSLIVSGQLARSGALAELSSPPCPGDTRAELVAYVAKKLGMADEEMSEVLRSPGRSHRELPSGELVFRALRLRKELGLEYRRWRQKREDST